MKYFATDYNEHIVKSLTKISTFTLNLPQSYLDECVNEIYKIGDKQNNSTNVKALMTSYHIWEDSLVFSKLLSTIKSTLTELLFRQNKDKYKITLGNAWGSIYKKGEFAVPHHHEPFHYSFVFYLKANHNSSPLNFVDSNLNIVPKENLLIFFPSYVTHQVLPNEDNERVMIAGNFLLEGKDPKEQRREVKIITHSKEGEDYIDIREVYVLDNGETSPTLTGISIPKKQLPNIITYLNTLK